ncbi:MAG TPA: C45 family peptidase [Bryobacteraceae bacterium]|nr:C45 family peptidase [Bryobacteraceae bacterium]
MRPILVCLAFVAAGYGATPFHASFDNSKTGWAVLRGAGEVDPAVMHEGQRSMRLEHGASRDAVVESTPVTLTIGKSYELTGWIRTDQVAVRDTDRSPIATGAAIRMASMPFDVHSESFAGTHDWTRVELRFTATRAQDNILLTAGYGGAFDGKAWFSGVGIDEAASTNAWPAPEAVTTYGPAYRYPDHGWIYLHIEGKPYERGYQHGRLMAKEIPQYMARCAAVLDSKGKEQSWDLARTTASALFLHGFDQEILEEMKGIADGASDGGARWQGRRIDLTDIVVVNTTVELDSLKEAIPITPNGLEGLHLKAPEYSELGKLLDHCSAFAATGPATRDGHMVIGHTTWWWLTLAEQTNVMLDIKPASGHRVLMQSYPGGIESGLDWYQNDAGVVLTETTIHQSPFNASGTPVAFRARQAIQYGDNIDQVVQYLGAKNNGLYTNEWLIGDAKTDEIAMYELGTYKTRLYRSSKNDWFEGTEGFYWGNNNAKDLAVRLESQPDPHGAPGYFPYVPAPRDLKWQELYREYKGKIDEQFGFLAFRTAPLVSSTAMDAKIATADMASRMMVWAEFGKPNEREWAPSKSQLAEYPRNDGLYPSGYHLMGARAAAPAAMKSNAWVEEPPSQSYAGRLWKGWLLPGSDADTWFVAGSTAYYQDLRSLDLAGAMAAHWAEYRSLSLAEPNAAQRYELAKHEGAIFLDQLRHDMGDERFSKLMADFFTVHLHTAVSAQSFLDAAGVKFAMPRDPGGPAYLVSDIGRHLPTAMLVYGTMSDAGANRYAAEQLQKTYLNRFEGEVPIRKDFEVTEEELRTHDVIFVGRPESNSALGAWKDKIGLSTDGGLFRIGGKAHASETEALAFAATNPLDRRHMVLVLAGNDALETVLMTKTFLGPTQYAIFDSGKETAAGFLK